MTSRALLYATLALLSVTACSEDKGAPPVDAAAAKRGEVLAQSCTACHSLNRNSLGVGPHLKAIVGRQVASVDGYDYSDALKAQNFRWDEERIQRFIMNPTGTYPGTKMAYGDLSPEEASDIVEYLRSLDQ